MEPDAEDHADAEGHAVLPKLSWMQATGTGLLWKESGGCRPPHVGLKSHCSMWHDLVPRHPALCCSYRAQTSPPIQAQGKAAVLGTKWLFLKAGHHTRCRSMTLTKQEDSNCPSLVLELPTIHPSEKGGSPTERALPVVGRDQPSVNCMAQNEPGSTGR